MPEQVCYQTRPEIIDNIHRQSKMLLGQYRIIVRQISCYKGTLPQKLYDKTSNTLGKFTQERLLITEYATLSQLKERTNINKTQYTLLNKIKENSKLINQFHITITKKLI